MNTHAPSCHSRRIRARKRAECTCAVASVAVVAPISLDEVTAMHAALAFAIDGDVEALQSRLTAAQWTAAGALFDRVDAWMSKPIAEKRKPSATAAVAKAPRSQGVAAKTSRRGVTMTAGAKRGAP